MNIYIFANIFKFKEKKHVVPPPTPKPVPEKVVKAEPQEEKLVCMFIIYFWFTHL